MNKTKPYLVILTAILFIAVLTEVINPHSFLGAGGAFVRVVALLFGAVCWYMFFKGTQNKLAINGIAIFLIVAMFYSFYGLSSYCGNKYYEINKEAFVNSRTDIEPYSCSKIILGSLFQ